MRLTHVLPQIAWNSQERYRAIVVALERCFRRQVAYGMAASVTSAMMVTASYGMCARKRGCMATERNPWAYSKSRHESILGDYPHAIDLDGESLMELYRFYVLYCPCKGASYQGRTLDSYGWVGNISRNGLGQLLDAVPAEGRGPFYLPKKYRGAGLDKLFAQANLHDGKLSDTSTERAAIAGTGDSSGYLRLFRHVRNCLAHGRFVAVRGSGDSIFLVMEDCNRQSITARMVLRLNTLLGWARTVEGVQS